MPRQGDKRSTKFARCAGSSDPSRISDLRGGHLGVGSPSPIFEVLVNLLKLRRACTSWMGFATWCHGFFHELRCHLQSESSDLRNGICCSIPRSVWCDLQRDAKCFGRFLWHFAHWIFGGFYMAMLRFGYAMPWCSCAFAGTA